MTSTSTPQRYEASAGAVTLDGVDVRDVSQADLARTVAAVEQEPALFRGSIRANVRFGLDDGDPRASDAAVENAAAAAGVLKFANFLPEGLETDVGAGGALLSGGQKQRVSIARALLRDPAVLVPAAGVDVDVTFHPKDERFRKRLWSDLEISCSR